MGKVGVGVGIIRVGVEVGVGKVRKRGVRKRCIIVEKVGRERKFKVGVGAERVWKW